VDRFVVNTSDLMDSADALEIIDSEFKNADDNSSKLADVVGHDGLADAIRDFSNRWEHHRNDMVSKIEELQKIMKDGATQIADADTHLARQAAGMTAAPPASPAPTAVPRRGGPQ
jgi:hypothetical protein